MAVAELVEIGADETDRAGAALRALRPRFASAEAVVALVDEHLRPAGYRLVGVFEDGRDALSVIGFHQAWSTAWGKHIYVGDLSTLPHARGRGYASMLLDWVVAEARRLGCEAVHLDSGVGADRATAHRLYMRHGFRISSHHFVLAL